MKRFIRYLYEYEQGKRIRNVGFVKVETGNEETIVHLQVKGFRNREQQLGLYLFFEENGRMMRIRHENIKLVAPSLSHHLIYKASDEKLKDVYSKMKGILVETEDGKRIVATWDDSGVDVSRLEEYVEPEVMEPGRDYAEPEMLEPGGKFVEPEMLEPGKDYAEPEMLEPGKDYAEPEMLEPEGQEKLSRANYIVTKISRQEISRLPRCEWKLANNQFLMHGYHNFHHLLLIENGKVLKLGVPGIYHIKEADCAKMFGFEEFLTTEELGIEPEAEEELFGYWCRPVHRYHRY